MHHACFLASHPTCNQAVTLCMYEACARFHLGSACRASFGASTALTNGVWSWARCWLPKCAQLSTPAVPKTGASHLQMALTTPPQSCSTGDHDSQKQTISHVQALCRTMPFTRPLCCGNVVNDEQSCPKKKQFARHCPVQIVMQAR